MFFFMSSLNTKRTVYDIGTGIAFSLAVLSKVTVVLLVVPFLIIPFVRGESTHDTIKKLIVFLLASITIPLGLLVAGYNLAIQALYQFALLRTGEGNNATGFFLLNQNPNPDLGNPLLNFLARTYHFRMIGYAILIFVAIAVCLLVVRRSNLTERLKFGIALASPVVVFVIYQYGLNLARQLLPYYGGIWFLGLAGVSWTVRDVPEKKRLLLYITALALTAASMLINL
jgi:disulfide bond formation protein DsbB